MSNINLPGINDYFVELALGNIPGHSSVNKFGDNPDVDGPEDVWTGGGDWTAPTFAQTHIIVSGDAADAAGGTGLRTLYVEGLDADWAIQTESLSMNGTTNVLTTKKYIRIYRMYGTSFGSGETNAGAITATSSPESNVTAHVAAGAGGTLMAIYTIPAGKRGVLVVAGGTINKDGGVAGNVELVLMVRRNADASDAGWVYQWEGGIHESGSSTVSFERRPYGIIPAKTDVKIRVVNASTTNLDVAAWFDLILVDD